jgi:hypothetical protein
MYLASFAYLPESPDVALKVIAVCIATAAAVYYTIVGGGDILLYRMSKKGYCYRFALN